MPQQPINVQQLNEKINEAIEEERKKADAALKQQAQEYQAALDHAA